MPAEIRAAGRFSSRFSHARLARAAARALRAENANGTVTVYVTGRAEIRRLNRRFHATNAPTDVLSFPAETPRRSPIRGRDLPYLGDIVIAYEQAREQARRAGWRTADELDLLAVHGVLHLLGYDDLRPRARSRMWKRQAEILRRPIPGPSGAQDAVPKKQRS